MEIVKKIFSVIWEIIKWFFVTGWGLTVLILALIDLWLGDGSWWRSLTERRPDKNNLPKPKEIYSSTTDKVVKEYGQYLDNYVASKSTTSIEEQILEKIRNSPNQLLKDVLSEEEMNIFIMMILKAYDLIYLD